MKKIIMLAVLALARPAAAAENTAVNSFTAADAAAMEIAGLEMPDVPLTKVVGGVEAMKGAYPFMVSLQNEKGHFCGGTLIRKDWVLTAAHCLRSEVKSVVLGLHSRFDTEGSQTFRPARIIVHPKRVKGSQDYDFALIKLDGEAEFAPIALNQRELGGRAALVVAGWGFMREDGELMPQLQKASVPLVPAAACSAVYKKLITPRMLCAGLYEGGIDACGGDSGGPLFMGTGDGWSLVGVVSWGVGCGQPGNYGVYGKVSSVADWIAEAMK